MVQTIKLLWNKWQSLKTWQQVLLAAPFILLTILILVYIISPIKSKTLDEEILKHNKDNVEHHVAETVKKEKKLEKEQKEIKTKRILITDKINAHEKETNEIIKEIDNADGNIDELMRLHERLSAKAKRNTK